jgi:hypothetical protein
MLTSSLFMTKTFILPGARNVVCQCHNQVLVQASSPAKGSCKSLCQDWLWGIQRPGLCASTWGNSVGHPRLRILWRTIWDPLWNYCPILLPSLLHMCYSGECYVKPLHTVPSQSVSLGEPDLWWGHLLVVISNAIYIHEHIFVEAFLYLDGSCWLKGHMCLQLYQISLTSPAVAVSAFSHKLHCSPPY